MSLEVLANRPEVTNSPKPSRLDDPFAHGGEAGRILRTVDWSRKPIGPVDGWPQSLRTALSICLASRHPICIIWGRDRLYLYNDAYAPIVGAKHPWALGESYITVWPEIWETSIRPILETVERSGEASWCDNLLLVLQRRGFNEECYFSFSFAPTRIEDGSVGGVFTAITETTPQVVGERRLRTLRDLGARAAAARSPEEAFRFAAEVFAGNAHDVPWALFYLRESDGAHARLLDRVGIEAGHAACVASIGLTPSDAAFWPLSASAEHGEPVVLENLGTRLAALPGGPWPEASHSAVVLPIARAGQAAPYGFIVAGVSPRRVLDDDYRSFLKLAAAHVATTVANAEAYAEERRRAEALAEIDRAKTAFFSNVSHEFRTPLTLMLGPLEDLLAKSAPLPEPVRDQLQLMHRNSLRLLKLVNSLLDFSRIEAGRVQASYEPVELGGFTTELASVFRAAVEKAGLRFIVECPPTRSPVYVDRDMWEKIVFNLLSNAFKFTAEGEIEVRLRAGDAHVQLMVRDTGVGVPTDELPNLFKRFHRIENIRSRTHEGTGIGLALAQELAKLHGGNIRASSQPGVGTTFVVTLPMGCAHLPAERISVAPAAASTRLNAGAFIEEALRWIPAADAAPTPPAEPRMADSRPQPSPDFDVRGARILVADDNADMRLYVRRLLEGMFTLEVVADGEAALAAVDTFQPDLVLTDIMMPRLDGLGLLRAVRQRSATRTIPVILLSARAGQEASVEGYEAGADDYLTKPFSARELVARVETHLRLAGLRKQAASAAESERLRLAALFQQAPAAICALRGPEHVVELVNPRYVALTGRTDAAELLGKPIREALPEVDGQGYFEILDRVFATGEPFIGSEMKVAVRSAPQAAPSEIFINFVYQPTRNRSGRVDGIFAHAVDVTDHVRARQKLERLASELKEERNRAHASERHLRAIVDTTPECVKVVARDGTVLNMNTAGMEMIQAADSSAVVGRNIYEMIAPEDRERFRNFHERVCAGEGGTLEFDVVGLRGTRRHMESHAVPLPYLDGNVVQLALTRDITEVRRARESLAAQHQELERLVAERTARLQQTIEQMEEFSYSVSHDLRSPVRAMRGYAEALLEDHAPKLDAEARELLTRIERNGQRMDRLIYDLLTYSRISRREIQVEPVAVDRLLREVIQQYPEFDPSRAQIDLPAGLPVVVAHEPSLTQVFSNLLGNAVKFIPPDTRPHVQVGFEREGELVRLWFQDNGIGIPLACQPRLFGMFERFHTDLKYDGTGIGLAIVRKAMERMNGKVGVISDGKSGSRFWILLPAADAQSTQ